MAGVSAALPKGVLAAAFPNVNPPPGATGETLLCPGLSVPQAAHLTSSTLFLARQVSQSQPAAILNPELAHDPIKGAVGAGVC